ncbi:MAG: dienelactone hydrolase family protein [Mycolicibacterium rufum]|nr:dienelactone hydrolase family protein [Mycolicibacterium rufum]
MAVINTSLRHDIEGTSYDAVLAHDDSHTAAQTVLVVHGMEGRSDLQLEFAGALTEWGYQAVAVDLFGEEVTRGGMDATGAEMARFLDDRTALAQRLAAVFTAVTAAPQVAGTQLAAIGFCFGGLCVLDLARAGHPLAGVALGREFSGRGIDWQLHAYGDTAHAFMAPWADDPSRGILYSESATRRAWTTLGHFLQECWDTDAAAH